MKRKKKFSNISKKRDRHEERMVGRLDVHYDGYGFVIPDEKKRGDVFIPPHAMAGAMDGDRVEATVNRRRGSRADGRVVKIVGRGKRQIVGRFERGSSGALVVSNLRRQPFTLKVPSDKTLGAVDGQTVVARILQYPDSGKSAAGEVIQILGERGKADTEIEITIAQHELPKGFPEAALQEARRFSPQVEEDQWRGRRDLRSFPIVTIDGENARDFDDGVFVVRLESGYKLFVAIADVSHYVLPQTAINAEGYQRATSVYFPDRCIPMLPEELSNHLCSLRPAEDRLSFVTEIDFDLQGRKTAADFYKAVIKSAARLTYTQVKRMMIDLDVGLRAAHSALLPHLEVAFELFEILRKRRMARGSIDFDLPEPEFVLDMEEGVATSILKAPRTAAHMLIEEFMIAANEAVAETMADRDLPMIFRVHDKPDPEKIGDFRIMAHNLGYALPSVEKMSSKDLARLVQQVRGKPEERLLNTILLRSLKQAVYSPHNAGHFGLASKKYTHFTSPIRRYPDLIVHRLLHEALQEEGKKPTKKFTDKRMEQLEEMADHCSKMERKAMEAEWEIRDLMVALFMKDKVGEEYEGVISGVTKFGFFVELLTYFVEGLVPLFTLTQDQYEFDEKHHELRGRGRKKRFRIGDRVMIRVVKVDMERRKLEFALI